MKIEKINNYQICRYITYAVKPDQSYVVEHIRRFICEGDSIYIFGVQSEEIEAIETHELVGVQIDELLNCKYEYDKLPEYSSLMITGKAKLVGERDKEELKMQYATKYGEETNGDIMCVYIEEVIN